MLITVEQVLYSGGTVPQSLDRANLRHAHKSGRGGWVLRRPGDLGSV